VAPVLFPWALAFPRFSQIEFSFLRGAKDAFLCLFLSRRLPLFSRLVFLVVHFPHPGMIRRRSYQGYPLSPRILVELARAFSSRQRRDFGAALVLLFLGPSPPLGEGVTFSTSGSNASYWFFPLSPSNMGEVQQQLQLPSPVSSATSMELNVRFSHLQIPQVSFSPFPSKDW